MNQYKLHNPLSSNVCELLIKNYSKLMLEYKPSMSTLGDNRVFGYERFIDDEVTSMLFKLDSDFIYSSCQHKPVYQTLMFNNTFYNRDAKGSGEGWHRDSCLKKQFKTIFYLVPVSFNNGPFQCFVEKSLIFDFILRYKRRFSNKVISLVKLFVSPYKTFTSDVCGCGFSINTNLVHRGCPIVDGERYAITVYSYFEEPSAHIFNQATKPLSPL